MITKTLNPTLGATLLIAGCCIGAGMIGLPVASAFAGFIPSTIAMFVCYVFTTITGLLLLEATLWFDKNVNLLTIAEFALGKPGKILTSLLFLFLFYCIFIAYFDGGGQIFTELLSKIFHRPIPSQIGILICGLFIGLITYTGANVVDNLNRYMLLGLAASYLALVFLGIHHSETKNLSHLNWNASIATIPILLICFGYQNLVPSITHYLNKNIKAIRLAIIIGNFIPFLIYLLWNFVILGMLPDDMLSTHNSNAIIAQVLTGQDNLAVVGVYLKGFSFFAIITSFLPTLMSFADFIKDGLKDPIPRYSQKEVFLYMGILVPPMICAMFYSHIFLQALSFAGGFIDVLLFAVLPATIILIGRHVKKVNGPYQVFGGIFTPLFILLSSAFILTLRFMWPYCCHFYTWLHR